MMRKSKVMLAALAVMVTGTTVVPEAAMARKHYNDGYYKNGRYYGNSRYRHRCGGGNGAVGTVAGGAGGALIGNAIGGGTLGTVAGGVGGALLGRHLDKKNTRNRRGC